ncbi:OLC1v1004087C1 [Oldenlandia corymbosa var. corymbosa]|uniref:OLC1v1004087C1 n=1 Tax=Oldenlandia corymbosa var. corymbosa TaxID=529605 RepID=A0AAV1DBG7_OLDCO|nr:OLC1v1004087C1 [Oldenlandia corymbosa var. corymbosa]
MGESPTGLTVMAVIRSARPIFRNAYDKLAFTVHSTFLASGFVLRATGPDAFSKYHIHDIHPDGHLEVGIDKWNQIGANYAFVYTTKSDAEKIVVKCFGLEGKLHIDALREGSHLAIARMEIKVEDYFPDEIDGGGNIPANNNNNNNNNSYDYASMMPEEEDFKDLVFDIHYELVTKFNPPRPKHNLPMPLFPPPKKRRSTSSPRPTLIKPHRYRPS